MTENFERMTISAKVTSLMGSAMDHVPSRKAAKTKDAALSANAEAYSKTNAPPQLAEIRNNPMEAQTMQRRPSHQSAPSDSSILSTCSSEMSMGQTAPPQFDSPNVDALHARNATFSPRPEANVIGNVLHPRGSITTIKDELRLEVPEANTKQDESVSSERTPRSPHRSNRDAANTPNMDRDSIHAINSPHRPSHQSYSDLKQFNVLTTLGTGTFGRVLLVRRRLGRIDAVPNDKQEPSTGTKSVLYALKVLKKKAIVELKQIEHINNERHILHRIKHPFIVSLISTYQDKLNVYMLLDYHQGGELFSHLRRAGRFSAHVTRFYVSCILLALEFLHAQDIVYRDLKPENLLLDAQGYVILADFGFAKVVKDRTWTMCGTPEYISPEIIQYAGHGKPSDWWAFGVLCYEFLCGLPPFNHSNNVMHLYEQIVQGRVTFPSFIDEQAQDLILRLLRVDLSQRLGNLAGGARDVRHHRWFREVPFDDLLQKKARAPIIPNISFDSDTRHFAEYPGFSKSEMPGLYPDHEQHGNNVPDEYANLFPHF